MIKNYIFDFGNVLGEFDPEKMTALYVGDKALIDEISAVAFDRLYWDKLDDGSITDDEVRLGIRSRLKGEVGDLGCKVYDNWVGSMNPVSGMEQLVEDISKTDKKLYLLSNISIGFAETYHDVPWISKLFSYFDGLVFSGVVGLVKPNKEIFEYVLSEFGLKAEECLFVDDNQANIQGAKAMGIEGYLFDGNAQKLREYLDI